MLINLSIRYLILRVMGGLTDIFAADDWELPEINPHVETDVYNECQGEYDLSHAEEEVKLRSVVKFSDQVVDVHELYSKFN